MNQVRWKGRVQIPVRISLPLRERLKMLLGYQLILLASARTQRAPGRVVMEKTQATLQKPQWMARKKRGDA